MMTHIGEKHGNGQEHGDIGTEDDDNNEEDHDFNGNNNKMTKRKTMTKGMMTRKMIKMTVTSWCVTGTRQTKKVSSVRTCLMHRTPWTLPLNHHHPISYI